jgi:hypothetical protein
VYIEPARKGGLRQVRVVAGDVHARLGLRNRIPLVCNALRSRELLDTGRVRIVADEGPPSGQSTTVAITYEVLPDERDVAPVPVPGSRRAAFLGLRGIARETFRALGGGEQFVRREREAFFGRERT